MRCCVGSAAAATARRFALVAKLRAPWRNMTGEICALSENRNLRSGHWYDQSKCSLRRPLPKKVATCNNGPKPPSKRRKPGKWGLSNRAIER
jgi:hypothetical protein